ncbi:MAG: hypothetical protein HY341_00075 [Candidatus Kerfeldbacteria bacterium]|nr:hypothetical protein [Candidatus Kerfeldbacteria bacterium]
MTVHTMLLSVALALLPLTAAAQTGATDTAQSLVDQVQQANQFMFAGVLVVGILVVLGLVFSIIKHSLKLLAMLVLLGLIIGGSLYVYGRMKGTDITKQYNVNYSFSPFGWPFTNVDLPDIDVNITISK